MSPAGINHVKAAPAGYEAVRSGIAGLLQAARAQAARSVNALMTASYWEIGRRIVEAEQKGRRRAGYGDALVKRLAADLTAEFGRGFGVVNLSQMRAFYALWPAEAIFQTLSEKSPQSMNQRTSDTASRQFLLADLGRIFVLPWSAYVRLLSVRNAQARYFYETEALRNGWSVRHA